MNEPHFFFTILYMCDLHNLMVDKKLRMLANPKSVERYNYIGTLTVTVVDEATPGFLPQVGDEITWRMRLKTVFTFSGTIHGKGRDEDEPESHGHEEARCQNRCGGTLPDQRGWGIRVCTL